MRRLVVFAAIGAASCGPPTVEGQISITQIACLEKAQQLFPKLKALDEADASTGENAAELNPNLGQFRMVSTGKFIWDWTLPSPATGKLVCTGDFNTRRIETMNYDGLGKRPAGNEVWEIPRQNQAVVAEPLDAKNMENQQ